MFTRLGFLATIACFCWGGDLAAVGVFVDFETKPTEIALQVMKREVAGILKSAGVLVNWRSLSENRGTEPFSGLVVLRFKGKCQVQPWNSEAPKLDPGATVPLGTTLVSDGKVLPYSEILCDQVRRTVPAGAPGAVEQERQWQLGRAMGRVAAHELYHVLARTTAHTSSGLAKARHSFSDLFSGSLKLDAGAASALKAPAHP